MSNVDNEFVETFQNLFDADQRDHFRTKHVTLTDAIEIAKALNNK
jgi:ribonuclease BN (tRNA processing enzyme)